MSKIKVSVIGLGYIGLPTAAIIASKNITTFGVDICETTVASVRKSVSNTMWDSVVPPDEQHWCLRKQTVPHAR